MIFFRFKRFKKSDLLLGHSKSNFLDLFTVNSWLVKLYLVNHYLISKKSSSPKPGKERETIDFARSGLLTYTAILHFFLSFRGECVCVSEKKKKGDFIFSLSLSTHTQALRKKEWWIFCSCRAEERSRQQKKTTYSIALPFCWKTLISLPWEKTFCWALNVLRFWHWQLKKRE